MIVKKAVYVGSVGKLARLPPPELPEVGFIGRSNVGKSSLLNKLLGVKRLALTSSTPGKTRTINFFRVNNDCFFVDLPGYGFAKVPKRERERWRGLIEGYLLGRPSLRLLILLIDARHGALDSDRQMLHWLQHNRLQHLVVLTKADKLGGNRLAVLGKKLEQPDEELHGALVVSATTGRGIKRIWRAIDSAVAQD